MHSRHARLFVHILVFVVFVLFGWVFFRGGGGCVWVFVGFFSLMQHSSCFDGRQACKQRSTIVCTEM